MLLHLRVRNLGVIEDAALEPSPAFTVITGETGAGKTLLLGGLRLILGSKTDSGSVGPLSDEAQVDALFELSGDETGVTRVIPKNGRSRSYLNGNITSADAIGVEVSPSVEIVGQHDQLLITRSGPLLEMVDSNLDAEGDESKAAYARAWASHSALVTRMREIGGDPAALARELDLSRYQAKEIERAGLFVGIDQELEVEVSKLRNVEEIRQMLGESLDLAEQMSDHAGEVVSRLRKVAGLDPSAAALGRVSEGLMSEVQELNASVREAMESLEQDPTRLEEIESTLTALGELKRKYGKSIEAVIEFGAQARQRADQLAGLLAEAETIEQDVERSLGTMASTARLLSEARSRAAGEIESQVQAHLADMGLARARVEIVAHPTEPTITGMDRIEMHFASDTRLEAGPVAKVASGGELSRLVLALRLATKASSTVTLVFDEVDTGIGGATALSMGRKLAGLAGDAQVLCVTHLPQVAASADRHYVVERDGHGVARVRLVEGDDRVIEITRMLAGLPESEAGQSAAEELLGATGNR